MNEEDPRGLRVIADVPRNWDTLREYFDETRTRPRNHSSNDPNHPRATRRPEIYHPAKNTGKLGAIRNALKTGPATTQQIAATTKIPLRAIQQNLQTMRRRFQVVRSLDGQWMLTERGRAYTS